MEQFWSATPKELQLAIKAHNRRTEAEYDRAAWMAATIINHMPTFSKRRPRLVTPNELLGKKAAAVDADAFGSRERWRAYMREQIRRAEEEDEEV